MGINSTGLAVILALLLAQDLDVKPGDELYEMLATNYDETQDIDL